MVKLSQRSIENIEECHPNLQKIAYKAASYEGCPHFLVYEGSRSVATQRRYVASGASKTMNSLHIIGSNKWSHAFDAVQATTDEKKIDWSFNAAKKLWSFFKKAAEELDIDGLEWGGNWRSFKDGPHFQLARSQYPRSTKAVDNISYGMSGDEFEIAANSAPTMRQGVGNFRTAIPFTLKWEGGFSNHKRDKGGATFKGVTLANAKAYIDKSMTVAKLKQLDDATIVDFYKLRYWDVCRCDMLQAGVDFAVFDYAVNSGPSRAIKALQSVVGVKVDGKIGAKTIAATQAVNDVTLVKAIFDQREAYLKNHPDFDVFGKGWINRTSDLRVKALVMVSEKVKTVESVKKQSPIGIGVTVVAVTGFMAFYEKISTWIWSVFQ